MNKLNRSELNQFVNSNIDIFHDNKAKILKKLDLSKILRRKNPYLFKAKNISTATDLIRDILDAFLSSSEEKIFGDFLEELAIYICNKTFGGQKSSAPGIDLEFINKRVHYLVSIKSGPNWGNSSQKRELKTQFKNAITVLKQSRQTLNVQAVEGICYGKSRTTFSTGHMKIFGQNFWYLISGDKDLYTEIIEPIGYKAKEHNEEFLKEKSRILNLFTEEFLKGFCDEGVIKWEKLVEFNSGNYH